MNSFLQRHLGYIVSGIGIVIVMLLVVIANASSRANALEQEIETLRVEITQARDDTASVAKEVEQLRGGVAIFSTQVTAFQEQLASLAPGMATGIGDAVAGLDAFATSTLEFQIAIDEEIPVNTVINLNRTITIPIQTSISIDETVETAIMVEVEEGFAMVDVTVPIQLALPIDLEVSFPIDEIIPISIRVPFKLDVPIAIEVAGTELATFVQSLRGGLASMGEILAELS